MAGVPLLGPHRLFNGRLALGGWPGLSTLFFDEAAAGALHLDASAQPAEFRSFVLLQLQLGPKQLLSATRGGREVVVAGSCSRFPLLSISLPWPQSELKPLLRLQRETGGGGRAGMVLRNYQ